MFNSSWQQVGEADLGSSLQRGFANFARNLAGQQQLQIAAAELAHRKDEDLHRRGVQADQWRTEQGYRQRMLELAEQEGGARVRLSDAQADDIPNRFSLGRQKLQLEQNRQPYELNQISASIGQTQAQTAALQAQTVYQQIVNTYGPESQEATIARQRAETARQVAFTEGQRIDNFYAPGKYDRAFQEADLKIAGAERNERLGARGERSLAALAARLQQNGDLENLAALDNPEYSRALQERVRAFNQATGIATDLWKGNLDQPSIDKSRAAVEGMFSVNRGSTPEINVDSIDGLEMYLSLPVGTKVWVGGKETTIKEKEKKVAAELLRKKRETPPLQGLPEMVSGIGQQNLMSTSSKMQTEELEKNKRLAEQIRRGNLFYLPPNAPAEVRTRGFKDWVDDKHNIHNRMFPSGW
jgi:hypothetical protein